MIENISNEISLVTKHCLAYGKYKNEYGEIYKNDDEWCIRWNDHCLLWTCCDLYLHVEFFVNSCRRKDCGQL